MSISHKKSVFPVVGGLVGVGLFLSGCVAGSSGGQVAESFADMESIAIVYNDQNAESSPTAQAMLAFQAEITEKTDGKVTFENYWSGALLSAPDILTGVSSGVADMSGFAFQYAADELPMAAWFTNAASMAAKSYPGGYLQTAAATPVFYAASELLKEELSEQNVVQVGTSGSFPLDMLCTKPISTLEEASGHTTRVGGPPWIGEVEAIGMTPVQLPQADAYEALQRGTIDCMVSGGPYYMTTGVSEVAKHYLPLGLSGGIGYGVIMNEDVWGSFPLEVKRIFHEAMATYHVETVRNTAEGFKRWATEGVTEQGVVFEDVSELLPSVLDQQRNVIASMPDSAPGGVKDPQKALDDYADLLSKWAGLVEGELGFEVTNEQGPEAAAEAMSTAPTAIDWAAYKRLLTEALAPYRPTD